MTWKLNIVEDPETSLQTATILDEKGNELPGRYSESEIWEYADPIVKEHNDHARAIVSVEQAFDVLKKQLQKDPSFAHTWHCNLACSFRDELGSNAVARDDDSGNRGASRFMKLCFDVETSNEMLQEKS